MNLTETEAKTKWCPFSRTAAFTDRGQLMAVTTNRDPRPDVQSSCNCIASECMAWKWGKIGLSQGEKISQTYIMQSNEIGYCGLMK